MTPALFSILRVSDVAQTTAVLIVSVVCVAHNVSGMLFSPDLDLDSRIHQRWGLLLFIWKPYKWCIPHRHFWSHGLVLPPLLRLGYFFAMIIGLIFVIETVMLQFGLPFPVLHMSIAQAIMDWFVANPLITLSMACGFVTGGAVHTIADWIVSGGKKLLRMLFLPRQSQAARKAFGGASDWMINPFSDTTPRHY